MVGDNWILDNYWWNFTPKNTPRNIKILIADHKLKPSSNVILTLWTLDERWKTMCDSWKSRYTHCLFVLPYWTRIQCRVSMKLLPWLTDVITFFFMYSWRSLIRFSRGIGFSSNTGAYRIVGSLPNSINTR